MRIISSIVIVLMCLPFGTTAWADAARISSGGAVHQMHGGGTVSMASEVVRIKISDHLQEVDCTFNFENNGPACAVRMGFPDFSNIPDFTSEETATNIKPTFLTYKCYVDGTETKSELVPEDGDYLGNGNDDIKLWHASNVQFPANSKITVRDVYSQLPDLSPVDVKEPIKQFIKVTRYILQTAASWHGPVKRADIFVAFDKDIVPAPIELVSIDELMHSNAKSAKAWWSKSTTHTLCYLSSVKPSVEGQELHFLLTNFRPTENDDLLLYYQPMKIRAAEKYARYSEGFAMGHYVDGVHVSTNWIFPKAKQKGKIDTEKKAVP
jgi:hypothetical protein